MAVVTILNEDRTLTNLEEITASLAGHGIDYERWTPAHPVADDAPAEEAEALEDLVMDAATARLTAAELQEEISILQDLEQRAFRVRQKVPTRSFE